MIGENVELERQYRKNLMIVSMIVLIYSIAGGAFDKDITFSGAKLTFSRPGWIEIFMLVVMGFLQWRHWLVSGDIRRHHRNEVISGLYFPSEQVYHLKYLFNQGAKFEFVDGDGFSVIKYGEAVGRVKIEVVDVCFLFILIKIVNSTKLHGDGELSVWGLTKDTVHSDDAPSRLTDREKKIVRSKFNSHRSDLLSVRYTKIIPFCMLNYTYRAKWIGLALKEVWFGDSLLPAFVTGLAFISYCLSKFFS